MFDIHAATNKIFDRVHRTGEEIKNDLPNWVERFVEAKGWTKVVDPATGKPFDNVGQWLVANYPLGPGMGQGRYAISYDEFIALCDDRPKLKELLIQYRPKSKGGRPKKETALQSNEVKCRQGNSRLYIEERLQRDHQQIWRDYLGGKYKSARQAGIAAGFIQSGHDPVKRMKNYWSKATVKEKREFLKWIEFGCKET